MRNLLRHVDLVKHQVAVLSLRSALTFGVSCAERQLPVHKFSTDHKSWQKESTLRSALHALWDHVLFNTEIDEQLPIMCQSAFVESPFPHETDWMARNVAFGFSDLAEIVIEKDQTSCYLLAQYNLDFLDAYLDDLLQLSVTEADENLIDSHPLMERERNRQLITLDQLRDLEEDLAIRNLRENSVGQSLLDIPIS
jgi:hypothetical protein